MSIFQEPQKNNEKIPISIEEIPISNKEIGKRIRDLIDKKRKTLGTVSAVAEISRPTLNKVLYGDFDSVYFGTIKKILDYLEVDFSVFAGLPSYKEYARMISEHTEREKQMEAMIEDFNKVTENIKPYWCVKLKRR
jgi:transcriptional regulator with XRE-family HTH domain